MANNAQKRPFMRDLHRFGDDKVQDWLQRQPQAMPLTVTKVMGNLVKVKVEGNFAPFTIPEIIIPIAASKWQRPALKVGDKGFGNFSKPYLGGQSGLAGGNADNYERANLTNLVFQPVTNKDDPAVNNDQNTFTADRGFKAQTTDGQSSLDLNQTNITVKIGNATFTMQNGKITADVAGTKIVVTPGRVDLGDIGGSAVQTVAGASSVVFAKL